MICVNPGSNKLEKIEDGMRVIRINNKVNPNNVPPCSSVASHESFNESKTPLLSIIINEGNKANLAPRYTPGRINRSNPKNTAITESIYAPNKGKNFLKP